MCNQLCSTSSKIHYQWTLIFWKEKYPVNKAIFSRLLSIKENLRKGFAQNTNLSSEDLNKCPQGLASIPNFDNKDTKDINMYKNEIHAR